MKYLSKLSLIAFLSIYANATEVQYGTGTFEIKGGFVGLDKSIDAQLNTYSIVEQHKSFFDSTWFYKYNFSFYKSKDMLQTQTTLDTYSNGFFNPPTSLVSPSIDYSVQGIDLNIVLGKDLYRKNENDYLGIGLMLGISLPYVNSQKDDDNDDSSSDNTMDTMLDSKTEISTYKIGPSITYRSNFNKYLSFYASGTYAYHNGTLKNDYINTKIKVNGIFQEYDLGFRFQAVSFNKDLGWFTLSPRLYATLGYRYTSWTLKDINLDITGADVTFDQMDFEMKSKITYFGVGYSF